MSVDGLVDFDPLDFLEGMAEESRPPRRGTGNSSRENENEELTSVLSTDVGEDDELEPDRLSVCVEDSAGASSEPASAVHPPPEEENGADALLSLTKRLLPEHYDFQIERVLKKTRQCSHVGLQMPDGLLAWAPAIAQILRRFHRTAEAKQRQNKKSKASSAARQSLNVSILGDVNFGACCVDDLTARGLGVELLVHFGHSCLIPTNQSSVRTMYVHVEVDINLDHFVNTVERNFFLSSGENDKTCPAEVSARLTDPGRVAILGTVQFASIIAKAKKELERRGSVAVLERLLDLLDRWNESSVKVPMTTGSSCRAHDRKTSIEHFTFLLSEISPDSLRQYERDVDFWVQIACPRLSLDWGAAFGKPCLTTYELYHLLAEEDVLLPDERAAYESAVARKKVHIEKWEAEQVATSSKTTTSLHNSSSSSSRPVEECATGPGGGMRAGGGSCTSCGNPGGGCGGEGADRIASLWPEVDYYANQAGPWANYGGGKTSGKKFSHM
eukprot:g10702.t1